MDFQGRMQLMRHGCEGDIEKQMLQGCKKDGVKNLKLRKMI